jgi:hypothetical protein
MIRTMRRELKLTSVRKKRGLEGVRKEEVGEVGEGSAWIHREERDRRRARQHPGRGRLSLGRAQRRLEEDRTDREYRAPNREWR